jgi:hypothetical protein
MSREHPVDSSVLRLPPYHQLGARKVVMRPLKQLVCRVLGHSIDVGAPVMRCRRCGETDVATLLTM